MSKPKISAKSTATGEKPTVEIKIDRSPKSEWKALGGGDRDQWNNRLSNLVTRALPVDQHNADAVSHAASAVAAGTVDMNPTDPVEGMLMAQLVVANEAAYQCTNARGHVLRIIISKPIPNTSSLPTKHRGRWQC